MRSIVRRGGAVGLLYTYDLASRPSAGELTGASDLAAAGNSGANRRVTVVIERSP